MIEIIDNGSSAPVVTINPTLGTGSLTEFELPLPPTCVDTRPSDEDITTSVLGHVLSNDDISKFEYQYSDQGGISPYSPDGIIDTPEHADSLEGTTLRSTPDGKHTPLLDKPTQQDPQAGQRDVRIFVQRATFRR